MSHLKAKGLASQPKVDPDHHSTLGERHPAALVSQGLSDFSKVSVFWAKAKDKSSTWLYSPYLKEICHLYALQWQNTFPSATSQTSCLSCWLEVDVLRYEVHIACYAKKTKLPENAQSFLERVQQTEKILSHCAKESNHLDFFQLKRARIG